MDDGWEDLARRVDRGEYGPWDVPDPPWVDDAPIDAAADHAATRYEYNELGRDFRGE